MSPERNNMHKYVPEQTAGAAISNGTQVSRQRELPDALERLNVMVDMLGQTVSHLGQQLTPVLGPEMPQDPNKIGTAAFASPVAARVANLTEDVRAIGSYVQSLIARLEV